MALKVKRGTTLVVIAKNAYDNLKAETKAKMTIKDTVNDYYIVEIATGERMGLADFESSAGYDRFYFSYDFVLATSLGYQISHADDTIAILGDKMSIYAEQH